MPKLIQIATIMRRLFLSDAVPWPSVVVESNIEKLRTRYNFTDLAYQPNNPLAGIQPQLFATRGEFVIDEVPLLVEQFIVQSLLVQFQIAGNSDQADQFAAGLGSFFLEIDPHKNYSEEKELTRTYQTIAVVKLSVPFERIFSDRLSQYLADTVTPKLTPPGTAGTAVDIRLQSLRWTVTYQPPTADFTYLPKPLVIEPRGGSRPEEMTYYTQSPTDFKTHMEMLEVFERSLS